MDNLTHTLTGLMLSRAGLRKFVPRASLLMMLAANAPDIDVVSWLGGTATYLRYHRGITHSLPAAPVMALLPVLIVWLVERRRIPWIRMWLLATLGVLSHLAFDWTNAYGIRLLLPFSDRWLRLDTVFVVDFALWAILLLGVAAPALGRLVSAEIGARPSRGTGWAVFALSCVAAWEYGRYLAHERAVSILDSRIYSGGAPVRVAAFAQSAVPWAWKGVVETSSSYIVFYMDLREDFDPSSGREFYKAASGPALEAARRTGDFDALQGFSNFLLWRVMPLANPEGGAHVELFDLRFGTPAAPGLEAAAIVDAANRVRETSLGFGRLQTR